MSLGFGVVSVSACHGRRSRHPGASVCEAKDCGVGGASESCAVSPQALSNQCDVITHEDRAGRHLSHDQWHHTDTQDRESEMTGDDDHLKNKKKLNNKSQIISIR